MSAVMALIEMLLLVIAMAGASDAIRRKRKGESWNWHVDVPWPLVGVVGAAVALIFVVAFAGALA